MKYLKTINHWKNAIIHTDSLSSLEALQLPQSNNEVIKNCHKIAKELALDGHSITLSYVPSHIGIIGNEEADQAAKEAALKAKIDIITQDTKQCIKNRITNITKINSLPKEPEINKSVSLTWWYTINNKEKIIDMKNRKVQTQFYKLKLGYKTYKQLKEINSLCKHCRDYTREPLIHYITECEITAKYFTKQTTLAETYRERVYIAAKHINEAFKETDTLIKIINKYELPKNEPPSNKNKTTCSS